MKVASSSKANNVVFSGFVVFPSLLLLQQQFQLFCMLPVYMANVTKKLWIALYTKYHTDLAFMTSTWACSFSSKVPATSCTYPTQIEHVATAVCRHFSNVSIVGSVRCQLSTTSCTWSHNLVWKRFWNLVLAAKPSPFYPWLAKNSSVKLFWWSSERWS